MRRSCLTASEAGTNRDQRGDEQTTGVDMTLAVIRLCDRGLTARFSAKRVDMDHRIAPSCRAVVGTRIG